MGIKIGVCGTGSFARCFIPLFKAHPSVGEICLADLLPERSREAAAQFGITRIFHNLEELATSDVDAIVLMTQRHMHGPQAVCALNAGKHVYSAVPMAQSLAEIDAIISAARRTRRIYMTGETSFYLPAALYCRERFRRGDFGDFVYGEGQYYHDMSHFYEPFQRSGGAAWKQVAGIPPMFYPTHSIAAILSATGAHAVNVSCLGVADRHSDGIFREGANCWDNVFSNQSALLRTSDGGIMRINEFRRIGWRGLNSVQMSLYGTQACFEEQADSRVWTTLDPKAMVNLNDLLACKPMAVQRKVAENDEVLREFHTSISKIHHPERLPASFTALPNGHSGSHQFLVDDFVKAVCAGRLPPNHAWASARYCAPGLIAHDSARKEGERLDVPDWGVPPADWPILDTEAMTETLSP